MTKLNSVQQFKNKSRTKFNISNNMCATVGGGRSWPNSVTNSTDS